MTSLLHNLAASLTGRIALSKMLRCVVAIIAVTLWLPQAGLAEGRLKLVTLTADWCAKCRVLEPALSAALETVPPDTVDLIEIDLTHMRKGPDARAGIGAATRARLSMHRAGWIWEQHEARTGLAFVLDARSGAPLACFTSAVPSEKMAAQLKLASRIADAPVTDRQIAGGTDCPKLIG
jgi:thiol-disulfide isomerase/thioredoxin